MSPIGLIDVSSLLRNPERMPALGGASGGAGLGGVDPSSLSAALGGAGATSPGNFSQDLSNATTIMPSTSAPGSDLSSGLAAALGPGGATGSSMPASAGVTGGGDPSAFSSFLSNAVSEVNDKLQAAEAAKSQVLTGETTNVHQAMIAVQESNVALSLMVEVRNKLVDSYQELMRMQV